MLSNSDFTAFPVIMNLNSRRMRGPYPENLKETLSHKAGDEAFRQISSWKGYTRTPLVSLSTLAQTHGLKAIHYKQEAGRFGLGSFKALGGAYAVFRLLSAFIEGKTGEAPSAEELISGKYAELAKTMTVTCATDGNHGRSVAWGAALFGCRSVIYIHENVSQGRADAIAGYGAKVVRTPGNYDDAVRCAAEDARKNGWQVVSDTSYPGYVDVPRNVMQGYSVMVKEALEQLDGIVPTHVFLQGGVGGLAAAVAAHLWEQFGEATPAIVIVEPVNAACLLESSRVGEPRTIHGDLDTIMAGLACGEPSIIAWPILSGISTAFIAIPDEAASQTMRLLASGESGVQMVAGESGVVGLSGLLMLASHEETRESIGLDSNSVVLLIGSEGATDPDLYQKIVGRTAADVEAAS